MRPKLYTRRFDKTFGSLQSILQILSLSLLITLKTSSVDANNEMKDSSNWNAVFSLRSDDDWRQLWHTEKHKRCYQDLVDHMEWVCDKDIYKLKSQKRFKRQPTEVDAFTSEPFLSAKEANMLTIVRKKRPTNRFKRGIIDECCNGAAGCSWEEYAEYCPANRRIRN